MKGPIIKAQGSNSLLGAAFSKAMSAGLAPLLQAGSKAAELYPHDEQGLLRVLHYRVQSARIANRRSRWFGGRFYNWMAGEDPQYLPMSGTHLRQALTVAGLETPEPVVSHGRYLLRLDVGEKARDLLLDKRGNTFKHR